MLIIPPLIAQYNYSNIDYVIGAKNISGGTRIDEFFDRMSRQFTKQEWGYVKLGEGTLEQLTRFYRLWVCTLF